MIEFLLQHQADIDITTVGELQTPIHFAAKNDACQALKLLIAYGANVNCRDYQNRTPIQVEFYVSLISYIYVPLPDFASFAKRARSPQKDMPIIAYDPYLANTLYLVFGK